MFWLTVTIEIVVYQLDLPVGFANSQLLF
jgi:hypothetical protein